MRFAMEEMPHVQTQIQNQTMSQNVTKEPKYVVQININLTDRLGGKEAWRPTQFS